MKRFLTVTFAVLVLTASAFAGTTSFNFGTTPTPSNPMNVWTLTEPDFSVTAAYVYSESTNPLIYQDDHSWQANYGTAAKVYWGDLDSSYGAGNVYGLGLDNDGLDIDQSHHYETLIFDFGAGKVWANSVTISLIGINSNADDAKFWLSYDGSVGPVNLNTSTFSWNSTTQTATVNLGIAPFSPLSTDTFGKFAIVGDCTDQLKYAVSGITYTEVGDTAVPEPASMFLLGTGLFGLAAKLRRKKA